jgi:hypothetical protein
MSFLLVPLTRHERGRRAAEIIRTSPWAFFKIAGGGYHMDRLRLAIKVSNDCRRLVKLGYLREAGRVEHRFEREVRNHPRGCVTNVYDSPQYVLTESGFCQVLSWDWSKLPDLRTKKRKSAASKNPFAVEPYIAAKSFIGSFDKTLARI